MNEANSQKVHTVTLIPGDGIGPEVTEAVVRILEATGLKFDWERYAAGADAFAKQGEYVPKELYASIERTKLALKGPVTTPIGGGFSSINVTLRKKFELYVNFRPIKNLPGLETRYPGRGPDHRSREYRRRIRGTGARGGARRDDFAEGDHGERLDTHCKVGL